MLVRYAAAATLRTAPSLLFAFARSTTRAAILRARISRDVCRVRLLLAVDGLNGGRSTIRLRRRMGLRSLAAAPLPWMARPNGIRACLSGGPLRPAQVLAGI